MVRSPKSESNAATALLREFKNVPNTGKNTPNNTPTAPTAQPQGITISKDILGGDVFVGDKFTVSTINEDNTVTLVKEVALPAPTG